jgi:NADH:ubiquinone oxidoreductase subunit F (NADH-binding)
MNETSLRERGLDERQRLLAGPPLAEGAESHLDHVARLGGLARTARGEGLIGELEASGLLGRGGAGFPVGTKWRSLHERAAGPTAIVVNGAEGEPWSAKDRVLMAARPHLVLDGAILAADALRASQIVVYLGEEHTAARTAMEAAIGERDELVGRLRLVAAPRGYVSGEASAAVHCINDGDARPMATPPRPSQVGVAGAPTLVQNVESLAYVALIARHGSAWYRDAGRLETRGTALVTIGGAVSRRGVWELELGTTVGELAEIGGASRGDLGAVLLGGYFGSWVDVAEAWDLPLDPAVLRRHGLEFGCGLVSFLAAGDCGVRWTSRILAFLAAGSARQCGPCLYGLAAISEAVRRLAVGAGSRDDLANVERWGALIRGRGACHHPDGAAQLLASALDTFGDDLAAHALGRPCVSAGGDWLRREVA